MTEKVRAMIAEIDPLAPHITEDDLLIENGIIDSIQAYSLIARIEIEWNITFPPEYMNRETFRTIKSIVEVIRKIQKGN